MDIRCPSCSKLFRVADDKIAGKGIRFKCSKCAEVITITKDDFEMDLLAREAEATEPAPQQQPAPATRPAQPSAPPQPMQSPEPEAREYQPPQEHDIPPAALNDFDFSEPHAAATAAAHPEEGFGGQDFSFNVEPEPEQDAVPEVEISPEAAAEAEAALQFPDDLISEPTRKPVFGMPSASDAMADEESEQVPEQKPKTGPVVTPPSSKPAPEMQAEEEMDLGAALAMPTGPAAEADLTEEDNDAVFGASPPVQRGPVISPELLEQMKRNAPGKSAVQAKAVSRTDDDIDLGAALAMPKTPEAAGIQEAVPKDAAASRGTEATSTGKRALVIGLTALVLVAVLASLYYLGFLWGKNEQEALQKPQPTSPPARQVITADGLSIVDPVAFIDPERGDIVITGRIQNTADKPKPGWNLVIEVRDAEEKVLTTVRMLNGTQIYSKTEKEILAKRGGKEIDELRITTASTGEGMIPPKGSVPFDARVMNPPAGSARFLPTLQSFDPSSVLESLQAGQ